MSSPLDDVIDRDFAAAGLTRDPQPVDHYRQTLELIERMLDLLERVITEKENGR